MKASWLAEILWPVGAWYLADLGSSGVFDFFAARGACSSALLCLVAPSLVHYALLGCFAALVHHSVSERLDWIAPESRRGSRLLLGLLLLLCAVTPVLVHWAGGRNMASQKQMVETYYPSIIATFALGAIIEEYVFRGVLQKRIGLVIKNDLVAGSFVSVSWLISHEYFWKPSSFIPQSIVLGLILSKLASRFGVAFAIIAHLVSNLALMAARQWG